MQNMNFSKNISNLRKIRGITQEELANHLGITKAAVSKWEKYLYRFIRQNYQNPFISMLS